MDYNKTFVNNFLHKIQFKTISIFVVIVFDFFCLLAVRYLARYAHVTKIEKYENKHKSFSKRLKELCKALAAANKKLKAGQ